MRDKDESLSIVDASWRPADSVRGSHPKYWRYRMSAPFLLRTFLQQVATIVLRLGALDIEAHPPGSLVQLLKYVFEFLRRDQIDRAASPRRDQEKHAPEHNIQAFQQTDHGIQVLQVVPGNRGVDLSRQAALPRPTNCIQGPVIGPWDAPKCIMNLSRGAVQADGQPRQATSLQVGDGMPGQQRSCARRERGPYASPCRVFHQFENVGALERVATGQHEDRNVHLRNLVDHAPCLVRAQFQRAAGWLGTRPA